MKKLLIGLIILLLVIVSYSFGVMAAANRLIISDKVFVEANCGWSGYDTFDYVITDSKTGVSYLVVCAGTFTSVIPMYNSHGLVTRTTGGN